ncbi:DNA cytosine methyltransferase, partial [Nocardia farcinica]|uniref:DNA cytosine methyltransferase n=1 Tax=Nocardia farcinica TaxID=37329 RepID=UPI0034269175
MTLTITDLFCGAGGSSTGAIQVPGVSVRIASNHWHLAVETHNTNHPEADHLCADLSQISPRYFPRTDILWASPECTNHSVAKGRKRADAQPDLFGETLPDDAAERSRATMWDVVRFSEHHRYRAVIVENVVDAYRWAPFQAWLLAMDSLGYEHHIVMLNSMHAQLLGPGAPQSRDRMYVVFWRKGNARPDIEQVVRPAVACPKCGPVRAMQAFKRPGNRWGRYRAQYVYRCPHHTCRNQVIEPPFRPAAEIIDWTLEGQRIGDRAKPLAAKTLARIQAGIDKYWAPLLVPVEGREGKNAQPVTVAARTMTTRNETGVAVPAFIAELRGGGSKHRPVTDPLCTVTASGTHHGLVTTYYGNGATVTTGDALPTCTTVERHGLITPSGGTWRERATSTGEPIPTRTTRETDGIAMGPAVDIADVRFRMLEPREIIAAMDFPREYVVLGNRREQVRMAGNAVTPPAARDLVGVVAES